MGDELRLVVLLIYEQYLNIFLFITYLHSNELRRSEYVRKSQPNRPLLHERRCFSAWPKILWSTARKTRSKKKPNQVWRSKLHPIRSRQQKHNDRNRLTQAPQIRKPKFAQRAAKVELRWRFWHRRRSDKKTLLQCFLRGKYENQRSRKGN